MNTTNMESWQAVSEKQREAIIHSIPEKWWLPASIDDLKDLTERSTVSLLNDLVSGKLSSVEVTEAFCGRAAIAQQCVNCLTGFFYEEAIARAAELDASLKCSGKPVGPLHGLPVAIKDIFVLQGKPATMALTAWKGRDWGRDASIVKLLKTAGAIHFASTTMPQTGMMLQTVSPLYGRTHNPFNKEFSAGGSSGGDGALVAMRGSPFCPSTDIGGSIRAPAAFNGLYGIRPTAERIPKSGMLSAAPGQTSIKVSCGPTCHSVDDVEFVTKLLTQYANFIGFEPTGVSLPWRNVKLEPQLVFAIMKTDGVVMPQPPILRALSETTIKLRAAGYKVVEIEPPIDFWEAAVVTWKLYFQTGGKEVKSLAASTGEPLEKCFQWYLDTFNIKELTVPELFQANLKQAEIKRDFAQFWESTKQHTHHGRPIDALICPSAPSASFPHDFPVWWGYFSIWNLIDYPSTIIPVKDVVIDEKFDTKCLSYQPQDNPFDKMNQDIYDPGLWKGLPISLQIVRQQYQDEELVGVTRVIDAVINE